MRYIIVLLLLFLTEIVLSQPGKYAGQQKYLIGKTYTDSREIKQLKIWQFQQGSVVNSLSDPETITVDVFQKGTTWVVFFSIKEDTASQNFIIIDVMEIKNVTKGSTVKTSFCRSQKIDNSLIVAWAKETPTEYLATIKKAWRFNPDKRRVELISTKGIDCLNERFDND
jgi:hypothetical protein